MNQPTTPAPLPPAPEGFINVIVDGTLVHVKKGSTVMDACTKAQKEIPHFCFHEKLSIAGNCRMCLVEIEGMPKPVASCHWPASEGMKVRTDSATTVEARKGTMEFLLINHPLDCPICDQGGECELQDQAVAYGSDRSHYEEFKRAVDDKDIGSKIKTVMTRCIHCTRCVRFATEIAGVEEFGATGRGENMQIGTYVEQALQSELAGNMIDLCPVGALTSRPYAYTARPWELERTSGVDILDAVGAPITIDTRAGQVMRVLPQEVNAMNDQIGEGWLTDAARFSTDALHTNRLTAPRIKKGKVQYTTGWPETLAKLKDIFKGQDKNKVAGLMGDLQSAEDAFAFRSFLKDTIGTDHLDARTDGARIDGRVHAANILNTPLKRFDEADAVLLVGCNPRLEAPLLNVRLRRAALKRRVPVVSVGAPMDLTYPYEQLENTPETLEKILDGKHPFAATLKAAQKPVIVLSASLFSRADGPHILYLAGLLASRMGFVKDGWNGFNVLQPTAGRVTALDMGVFPQAGGKATSQILKAWQSGSLDVLFVYGDGSLTADDLKEGQGTLIYMGTHLSPIAQLADVVLPAAAWPEKAGLYANAEGRVQESAQATNPPLHAKEDWKIFRALSGELGRPLPFDTLAQLRAKVADHCAAYAPQNRGQIVPAEWQEVGTAGAVTSKPFTAPVQQYYLRTAYHRESPTMHACQAEQGLARIKPDPNNPTSVTPGNIPNKPRVKSPPAKPTRGKKAA